MLPLVGDTVELINNAWEDGKRILIEGANATMLDLDFGTYPFVTSSNPSIGGVASGLGLAPTKFQAIIGVVRCFSPSMHRLSLTAPVCHSCCLRHTCGDPLAWTHSRHPQHLLWGNGCGSPLQTLLRLCSVCEMHGRLMRPMSSV